MWQKISSYLRGIRKTFAFAKGKIVPDVVFGDSGRIMYVLTNNAIDVLPRGKPYGCIKVYSPKKPYVAERAVYKYKWDYRGTASEAWTTYDNHHYLRMQFNDEGTKLYLLTVHKNNIAYAAGTVYDFRTQRSPMLRQWNLTTAWDLNTIVPRHSVIDRTIFMPDSNKVNAFNDRHYRVITGFQIVNDGKTLILNSTRGRYIDDAATNSGGAANVDGISNNGANAARGAKSEGDHFNLATTSSGSGTGATIFLKVEADGQIGSTVGTSYGLMNPGKGHANNDVLTITDDLGHSGNTKVTVAVNGLITDNSIYHDKVKHSTGNNGLYSEIYQVSLTTAWDVTSSYTGATPLFNSLGTHVFSGSTASVSSATDTNGSTTNSTVRANIGKTVNDIAFNADGSELYVLSSDSKLYNPGPRQTAGSMFAAIVTNINAFKQHISRYRVATPYDITTMTYVENSEIVNIDAALGFEKSRGQPIKIVGLSNAVPGLKGLDVIFRVFEMPAKFGSSLTSIIDLNTYDMSSNPILNTNQGEVSFNDLKIEKNSFNGIVLIGIIPFKQPNGSIEYAFLLNGSGEIKLGGSGIFTIESQRLELPIVTAWKTIFIVNKNKSVKQKQMMVKDFMNNPAFASSGEMLRYLQYWYDNPRHHDNK